ncbi:hypothetical protein BK816_08450 [Boudabousia tangfeifanii]|uniref:Uncharacterized protein n=1 Tax=Boudabousia tangfeifanii TaxID=1912795 RepID=A0A1D9MLY2_9ACTO|nr:glycosyltransferase [Boudabousia tangfeifanii]AOZ73302.1 hypothetical protein BK816_08450 [Boudabousia tangfeifanii]
MTTVVYHTPYPLNPNATAASGIRPVKMRQAFENLGCEVIDLTGDAKTRKQALKGLLQDLQAGRQIDLCYSESANIPNTLCEPKHYPPHPFLESRIFTALHQAGVPTGLFYRDVYWRFPDYEKAVGKPMATALRQLFQWDLGVYRRNVDRLFVPSLLMAENIPGYPLDQAVALPPGSQIRDTNTVTDGVRILYIGAVSAHYQNELLFQAVAQTPGVELVVCTTKESWAAVGDKFAKYLSDRVRVVHKSGDELNELYEWATICSVFMEPVDYWAFAQPMKVYEYLGAGKPMIASEGTMVSQFVSESGTGWTIPYEVSALTDLLERLRDNPDEIVQVANRVKNVRQDHTWEARAQLVIDTLTSLR